MADDEGFRERYLSDLPAELAAQVPISRRPETVSRSEYEALVASGRVDSEQLYFVTDDAVAVGVAVGTTVLPSHPGSVG